jgi:sulfotransferase family protein
LWGNDSFVVQAWWLGEFTKSSNGENLRPKTNCFIIDGLPRTGTTTLARILNCHPDISCLIEPFHPRRYDGQFHRMAMNNDSVKSALALIKYRWNGLKHVWSPDTGWPFTGKPALNEELVLSGWRIVFVQRRNFLKRYVSHAISKALDFWIGTKQQFSTQLGNAPLPELDPEMLRCALKFEREAMESRSAFLREKGVEHVTFFYEDFYGPQVTRGQQLKILNDVLGFLGFSPITSDYFMAKCFEFVNPEKYQWCSEDVYRLIPGVAKIEKEVGSDVNGWLFSEPVSAARPSFNIETSG